MKRLSIILTIITLFFTAPAMAITINEILQKHGKRTVREFILEKSPGTITAQVDGVLLIKYGRISTDYITAASINNDLRRLGISVDKANILISKEKKVKDQKRKELEAFQETGSTPDRHVVQNFTQKQKGTTTCPKKIKTTNGKKAFLESVKSCFSESILHKTEYKNGVGSIYFNVNNEYLGTGDKINKIFAIESARIFAKTPELNKLIMSLKLTKNTRQYSRGKYILIITRRAIENYYNLEFTPDLFEELAEPWRQKFIPKYDTKALRAVFFKKFALYEGE